MFVVAHIYVNSEKPECNGPFLIYSVPDFTGLDGTTEYKGYYIVLPTDVRFAELDETVNWYTANVNSDGKSVSVKVPAFPFGMFPNTRHSQFLYNHIMNQVDSCVSRSMNHAHSAFDETEGGAMETVQQETRKWKYYTLDFSKCSDFGGTLSSQKLFAEAGERETLDYDLISVPVSWEPAEKPDTVKITREEEYLGFRVANLDKEKEGRKTQRKNVGQSRLAQKRAEKRQNMMSG